MNASPRRLRLGSAARVTAITVLATALYWLSPAGSPPAHAAPNDGDPPPPVTQSDDLDGDNVADTVTSDPDGGDGSGDDAGVVEISSGADGTLVSTIEGKQAGDKFGQSVASSWDVNNDGFKDLVIGAPKDSTGKVYVFNGPFDPQFDAQLSADDRSLEISGPDADIFEFGFFVKGVPDANDDGVADVFAQG